MFEAWGFVDNFFGRPARLKTSRRFSAGLTHSGSVPRLLDTFLFSGYIFLGGEIPPHRATTRRVLPTGIGGACFSAGQPAPLKKNEKEELFSRKFALRGESPDKIFPEYWPRCYAVTGGGVMRETRPIGNLPP